MTEVPGGGLVIGLREVYDQLVRLTSGVGDLRGDLQRLGDQQATTDRRLDEHAADDRHRLADHESRLRGVERRLWLAAGGAAALAGGGSWLAQLITGGG